MPCNIDKAFNTNLVAIDDCLVCDLTTVFVCVPSTGEREKTNSNRVGQIVKKLIFFLLFVASWSRRRRQLAPIGRLSSTITYYLLYYFTLSWLHTI